MEFMRLEGSPFHGKELERLREFLACNQLDYDEEIEYTICLLDENYRIVATGSAHENVLKCIAVDPEARGFGLAATIVSALVQYEFDKGRSHILLYTKPGNQEMFENLGFYSVLKTGEILFMENRKEGFYHFIRRLKEETPKEALLPGPVIGCMVVNCNPFTNGHRYLVEQAKNYCDYLHVLVLSDDRSLFKAEERYQLVKEGVRDLSGVIVHRSSDFVISAATFPTYFMKEKAQAQKANCLLDLTLFARRIAPELGITRRFVGTEPNCAITSQYNEEMKQILSQYGIEVMEFERKKIKGTAVSASAVRIWYEKGDFNHIKDVVPQSTLEYLINKKSQRSKG
ncbi:[citrate (pro-3S)-lyase] ligase [Lacrimispora amygdalina]|uniref:[citrate (pro-3S)-lyase] ligase n=1 Tax=Lacrimispora amygdalina TaxID=253257 RepID=UPI000BE3E26A|nr:[citrate (pro-3S)-lyase] ligase [Lacrimispora amygdalina]